MIFGSGRFPGEGNGNSLEYSCLENSMDKRSLAGHSPWGQEEVDTTEKLKKTAPTLALGEVGVVKGMSRVFPSFIRT